MSVGKMRPTVEAKELERLRRAAGLSQRALACDLGITQGHYSKVISGVVSDKKGYVQRGLRLLSATSDPPETVDRLVQAASREIRNSAAFRRLVEAALRYSCRGEP